MKIAYIIYPDVIISNRSNGVRAQAITWGENLRKLGHIVHFINNWSDYDWKTYDVIHFFGSGDWAWSVSHRLGLLTKNLVISPIIDPVPKPNFCRYKLKYTLSQALSNKINFKDNNYEAGLIFKNFKKICVRSMCEYNFVSRVFNIPKEKLEFIPLSYDNKIENIKWNYDDKDKFCLHISSIFQPRKNVIRLIQAAKKYNFNLVLAGNKGTNEQYAPINEQINNSNNIKVLGFISEEQKIDLYKRAKVFALPSIQEGVGIVALDAAVLGCEIVISNIPGPKEYYNGKCLEVDPFDVDSIGSGINEILSMDHFQQPYLSEEIKRNYSLDIITHKLELMYKNL